MKIAQVVCRFKPYKGGISNMAYDYSLGLAKLGHQITVFTPLYNEQDKDFKIPNFEIKRLTSFGKLGNGAFLPQLFWQLKNFEIVHLHYPFFGGAEVVWLLKLLKKEKMKLVITYHMDVIGGIFLKPFFKFHTKFIMPRIINAADKVIVTSVDYAQNSNIKELVEKNPAKFIEIPPSVDLTRFFPSSKEKELLYKYGIHPEFEKILLFVGALDKAHYFKGVDFLIRSFDVLDHFRGENPLYQLKLLVVGEGNLKEKYKNLVAKEGLQEKVIFSEPVSDSDLPNYYNLADLVVLPSIDRSEAFGITLIEAMACAKPVVASNLPGVRNSIDSGINGYTFEVKNEGDMAYRINAILSNNVLRDKMGQAGQTKAEKFYSQDILIKKLENLYKEL